MGVEIERKFLVANDGWRANVISSHKFLDGLLATSGRGKIRVRVSEDRAWITVKGHRTGLSRAEFEYEIPRADAEEIFELCVEPLVQKVRHCVTHHGQIWSVDVHEGDLSGLVLAEVELENEAQRVVRPRWLGREITSDTAFSKHSFLQHHTPPQGTPDAIARQPDT